MVHHGHLVIGIGIQRNQYIVVRVHKAVCQHPHPVVQSTIEHCPLLLHVTRHPLHLGKVFPHTSHRNDGRRTHRRFGTLHRVEHHRRTVETRRCGTRPIICGAERLLVHVTANRPVLIGQSAVAVEPRRLHIPCRTVEKDCHHQIVNPVPRKQSVELVMYRAAGTGGMQGGSVHQSGITHCHHVVCRGIEAVGSCRHIDAHLHIARVVRKAIVHARYQPCTDTCRMQFVSGVDALAERIDKHTRHRHACYPIDIGTHRCSVFRRRVAHLAG